MKLKGTIENLHISYELQESTLIMWSTVDDRVRMAERFPELSGCDCCTGLRKWRDTHFP